MLLRDLSDTCDFVCDWLSVEHSYPPQVKSVAQELPDAIGYLKNRFGQLWQDTNHPIKKVSNHPTRPLSLFEFQDTIVDPKDYQVDTYGNIPFVFENQGVWQFGFSPSKGDTLFVKGDWYIDGDESDRDAWSKLDACVDDALFFALLGNLCLMCSEDDDWDFDDAVGTIPQNERVLLWRHLAWDEFDGFWTNVGQTQFHYSQAWLTVKKRNWSSQNK